MRAMAVSLSTTDSGVRHRFSTLTKGGVEMKSLSHVAGRALVLGLIWVLMGAPAALAADEPGKQTPPSGDVQERGFQRGTFGGQLGTTTKPQGPTITGWYCTLSNKTCYCDRTTKGDCEQMNAMVCDGPPVNTHIDTAECKALSK